MLCLLKCFDIFDLMINYAPFQVQKPINTIQKATHLLQITPRFSVLPEYSTLCFPHCTDARSSWGIILYQGFHFLTPAPPPPPLIQTQLGKFFQQENNIVTLNQLYKKRKLMTNEFCSIESKSSEGE